MLSLEERRESLSAAQLLLYGRLTDRFEGDWRARPDRPPDPANYLPDPPGPPLSNLVLLHNVKVDLEYRATRGRLPAPADLIGRFPSLRGDTDSFVELLAWGARLEAGHAGGRDSGFDLTSLAREFPELGGAIAARLAALDGELEGAFPLERVPEGYLFIRELERGGMSRVALVWNEAEQRQEVLKLNDPAASNRPDAVARFRQEIEIAGRVTGGRVVNVHRAGRHDGLLFYTMPYLAGGSLRDRFKAHATGLPEGVRILAEVARVVQKLHEHETDGRRTPIIHRDLKPGNILFPGPGPDHAQIADLGLAKLLDDGSPAMVRTTTGEALGTPGYMAPEQVRAAVGPVGPTTDVYALGAILYELLTGRVPLTGASGYEVAFNTLYDIPKRPREVAGTRVPAGLSAVTMKALEKVPSRRYPTAAAFADELDRHLAGRPVLARELGGLGRAWAAARRYPFTASLAALLIVSLTAATLISMALYVRADRQRRRADRNAVRRARSLGELAERVDRTLPRVGLTRQQADILGTISADLAEVARENQGLGSLDLGGTLNHEAAVLFLLGKPAESLAASEQAEKVFAALPASSEARLGLAIAFQQSGRVLQALARPAEGKARTKRALALLQGLAAERPDDPAVFFRLARTLVNVGNFRLDGDPGQAVPFYRQALEQYAQLRRLTGDTPEAVEWDARTRSNLGLVYARLNRTGEAIALQSEAAALAGQVVAANPGEVALLDVLATCQNNLGDALGLAARLDEADAAFLGSLSTYRTLAQRFPDEPEFRWGVAMVKTNIGGLRLRRKEWEQAAAVLAEAGDAFDALLKSTPDNPDLRDDAAAQRSLLEQARSRLASPKAFQK